MFHFTINRNKLCRNELYTDTRACALGQYLRATGQNIFNSGLSSNQIDNIARVNDAHRSWSWKLPRLRAAFKKIGATFTVVSK